jgi:anaerobic selenocysteine-containing dehydrogenase
LSKERKLLTQKQITEHSKHADTSISRRDFLKLSATVGAVAALSELTFNEPLKTLVAGTAPTAVNEDKWIKSECRVCSTVDYINAHVVNGVINKIEGYPDPNRTRGKLCARGSAGYWFVYDPYRVKAPLKRTNPQKGIGVDPKWVEISWDEAYNTIAEEAKKVRAKNGSVWFSDYSRLSYSQGELYTGFKQAMIGDCYAIEMGMNWCGHVMHYLHRTAHGAFADNPDYQYCNYLIMFGSEEGFVYDSTQLAEFLTDAHDRGMKIVYVNPVMSTGMNTIDEWIPILPSTDGAFASAMLNVLIHELGIYDVDSIKKWTDGPYLVRADNGHYVRDTASNKPLVWDPVDNVAKTFDDPSIKDYAIEGTFTVGDARATPSWQLLKEAVKPMTPEWAEPITTVPAATIRRIANEWGQAAQVGSTIGIGGKQYPLRPVSLLYQGNAANHVHGFANGWSIMLLPMIVGALDVPGGTYNRDQTWVSPLCDMRWKTTKDGLIPHPDAAYTQLRARPYEYEYPPKGPELEEFLPFADHLGAVSVLTMSKPNDFWNAGQTHRVEFGYGHAYGLVSMYALNTVADILSDTPFLALSSIFMEEPTDFADIVLPDRVYLEEYQLKSGWLQQPVVEPLNPIPHIYDVWIEIADRTGCLYGKGGFNDQVNIAGRYKAEYKLDLNKKYTTEQIFDLICQNANGKGLDWWKENGGVPSIDHTMSTTLAVQRGIIEWYKKRNLRLPIYIELHKVVADQLKANMEKNGVSWNYEDFNTLPTWIPSHINTDTPPYDLIEVAYLQNTGGFMSTNANPWIAEIAEKLDPFALYVWINEETAKAKGIASGDLIWVESEYDKRQGYAKLSQTIHPNVIAVSRHFGKWAGNSVTKSLNEQHLGLPHQALRPDKLEYIDRLNATLENDVKVRVYKA